MPFYLWLRSITGQRLLALCREHLGAQKRDVRREQPLADRYRPEATSETETLAVELPGKLTSPSQRVARDELRSRLQDAIESMESLDRETIALHHFEELGNSATAQVLGIGESAASKRSIRAMKRLREILAGMPGVPELAWN